MFTASALDYLRLSLVPGVGAYTGRQLISAFGSVQAIWQQSPQAWLEVEGVGPKLANTLAQGLSPTIQDTVESIARQCEAAGIHIICPQDEAWPPRLEACADAPLVLFAQGDPMVLQASSMLAVVGARKASAEGKLIAKRWSSYVSQQGVVVVSGMAPGIDAAAHSGSLHANKPGVAVLGYGHLTANPQQQKQIEALSAQGCVISEYAPDTAAKPIFFPQRNRLIAGLSQALIVIEGGLKSGSLITARQALHYGREVFAVPGSVLNDLHAGCHQLIQDGAILATDAEYVLQHMGWQGMTAQQTAYQPEDAQEAKIIALLRQDIMHVDTLAEDCGLTVPALSTILLRLELQGVIEKLPGSRYTLC